MTNIATIHSNLKGDKTIWFIVALLAIFSALAVYSSTFSMAYASLKSSESYLLKHTIIIGFGLILTYGSYRMHYMQYSRLAPILLLLAIPLLIYTFLFAPEINDARRWITLPIIGMSFQPSDFAKLALIIFVARAISSRQENIKDFRSAFLPIIVPVIIVCLLIAKDDFSSAGLLFLTCTLMMFVGRVDLKYIGLLILLGVLGIAFLIILGNIFPEEFRTDTWFARINSFITNADGGWQIQQSKIAIADGGIFGVGPGNSVQRNFLPYPYADFIYAIICEEYGLFGAFVIISLYMGLFYRCTSIVTKCQKNFGAMLAIGLCLSLVIQAFANIAVSVHLVPVTGLTLPLISMGGSSLLFTCISFGIILSVSRYIEANIKTKSIDMYPAYEGYH